MIFIKEFLTKDLTEQLKKIESNLQTLYKFVDEKSFNDLETLYEDERVSFSVQKKVNIDVSTKTFTTSKLVIKGYRIEEDYYDYTKVEVFEISIDDEKTIYCDDFDVLWKLDKTLLKDFI